MARDFYDCLAAAGFMLIACIMLGALSICALAFAIVLSPFWIIAVVCKAAVLVVRAFAEPRRAGRR